MNVLYMEDNLELVDDLSMILSALDINVTHVKNKNHFFDKVNEKTYDLYLLDLMIGEENQGQFVCEEVRKKDRLTPIVVLTGTDTLDNLENLFYKGADDFIVKPFKGKDFISRIQRNLQRKKDIVPDVLEFDTLSIDFSNRKILNHGKLIDFTFYEYKIISILCRNLDNFVHRDDMIKEIQGENFAVTRRTIDTHMVSIRKKLGETHKQIQGKRGIGYGIFRLKQ